MIVLDKIRIRGFRSIRSLEMPLERPTVLIGSNNCGKSTVLKALQLALTDELEITQHDFHTAESIGMTNEIIVDVRFVPVDRKGRRLSQFDESWTKILSFGLATNRHQKAYFAFRTRVIWNAENDTATLKRTLLTDWENEVSGETLKALLPAIKMVLLDADDDLLSAINRPNSFVRRTYESLKEEILAHPQYAHQPFEDLRATLDRVSEALEGPGSGLPDGLVLSPATIGRFFDWLQSDEADERLSVRLGRGSRKTLLILSTITLLEGLARQAEAHDWPLFILIAADEPEAHLHPNAQRTLMRQLMKLSHQLLVTTHSPFVASVVTPTALRSMARQGEKIDVRWLPKKMSASDLRTLSRMIMRLRGEVLFARGLMFVEGVTEEQLIRGMFHAYFGDDPSAFGITIVGVDGKSYAPFFLLAMSFHKPFCVVSDNDGDAEHVVRKQLAEMEQKARYDHRQNQSDVFFLSPGLAIEGELVNQLDIRAELIDALVACSPLSNPTDKNLKAQRRHFKDISPQDLKHRLEKKKSNYSSFLGDIIERNPYERHLDELIPISVKKAFILIKEWIK